MISSQASRQTSGTPESRYQYNHQSWVASQFWIENLHIKRSFLWTFVILDKFNVQFYKFIMSYHLPISDNYKIIQTTFWAFQFQLIRTFKFSVNQVWWWYCVSTNIFHCFLITFVNSGDVLFSIVSNCKVRIDDLDLGPEFNSKNCWQLQFAMMWE